MDNERQLHIGILMELQKWHPTGPTPEGFRAIKTLAGNDDRTLASALKYLEGLGLVKSGVSWNVNHHFIFRIGEMLLTSDGIDFLKEDGGLSAVLKTITVKIHDDSLTRVCEFLQNSSLEPPVKRQMLDQLKQLPADAIRHVLLKLLDLGLENSGGALQLLQKYLG